MKQERNPSGRIKILEISEPSSGGIKKFLVDLLASINSNTYDVTYVYSEQRKDGKFDDELARIRNNGVKTFRINMTRKISPIADLLSFVKILKLILNEKFDIVHAHGSKAGFLARIAAKIANRKIITVYSPHAISVYLNSKYWYLERFASLFTDKFLAVSPSEKNEIIGFFPDARNKTNNITLGIDPSEFKTPTDKNTLYEIKNKYRIPKDYLVIGSCNRLSFQKNPEMFVEVASRVIIKYPDVRAIWIGDGELREKIEFLIEKKGLSDKVIITGWLGDIKDPLSIIDIFFATSRYESFGYSVCEAMSFCKPVIATKSAGFVDLVEDGITGYVVPENDVSDMTSKICELIENPDTRYAMGKAGRIRVEKIFSMREMVSSIENYYDSLSESLRNSNYE